MPGPVVTPFGADLPPEAPIATAPAPAPPIPTASDGPADSTNVGGSVTLPTVNYTLPKVQGESPVDRGPDAEFEVLSHRYGDFVQGSRLALADIPNPADLPRFLELGALKAIEKPAPVEAPAEPAPKKGK